MPILRRREEKETEIPTASMGDIAFLLIIFFMVSTILTRTKGIKFRLPEKLTKEVKVKQEKLIRISINDKNEIYINDELTPLPKVREKVDNLLSKNPKLIIILKTHEDAKYERMVQVLDELRQLKTVPPDSLRLTLGVIRAE